MSILVGFEHGFRWMAEHGVWDIVTALAVVAIALLLRGRTRRPLRELTIQVTHSFGNHTAAFPNTLGFELRNPLDAPVLITRPSFVFSKHLPAGAGAALNTVTGTAELRFRSLLSDGTVASQLSHETAMLRSREGAFAFVPVSEKLSEEQLLTLARNRRLGTLQLDVVMLGESPPRAITVRLPIQLTLPAVQAHSLDAETVSKARRASERPSALPLAVK